MQTNNLIGGPTTDSILLIHIKLFLCSSYSILKIPITKELFRKGRLKIRCVASIHDVYYRSLEKSVDLEKKRHNHHHHKHIHHVQQDGKIEGLLSSTTVVYPHDIEPNTEWEYEALPAERHPEIIRKFQVRY